MDIRFYGRRVDADIFEGRAGRAIRALNRCRLFAERVTEIAVVLYQVHDDKLPLSPVVTQLLDEGVTSPAVEHSRPPIAGVPLQREASTEPEFEARHFRTRRYQRRSQQSLPEERERRSEGIELSDDLSIHSRYRAPRSSRHNSSPLVVERFTSVGDTP